MTLLRGHFAMMLVGVGRRRPTSEIRAALAPLTADGTLSVTVREVPVEETPGRRRRPVGADRARRRPPRHRLGRGRRGGPRRRQHHRPDHPPGRRPLPADRRDRPARRRRRGRPGGRDQGRRRRRSASAPRCARPTPTSCERSRDLRRPPGPRPSSASTGRVLDVVRAPAPVLSTPGGAVDPTSPEVVQLAADLVATMRVSPGCVGLAAPQVGVAATGLLRRRLRAPQDPRAPRHLRAVQRRGRRVLAQREGPRGLHERARPHRRREARLAGSSCAAQLPGTGEEVEVAADAFEARALQHEIDHCAGLLFLDRVAGAHAVYARQTYL